MVGSYEMPRNEIRAAAADKSRAPAVGRVTSHDSEPGHRQEIGEVLGQQLMLKAVGRR